MFAVGHGNFDPARSLPGMPAASNKQVCNAVGYFGLGTV